MDEPNPPTAPAPGEPASQRPPRRRLSDSMRLMIGSVIFLVIALSFTYGLLLASAQFGWNLDRPIFGPQTAPLNWLGLINLVMLVALWLILQRLGFLPRGGLPPPDRSSRWRDRQ
ncbi:MAG: hypothetical protein KGO05_14885 [Chloroflexota bacterium]|nr:hypothetical protein [Chloroflexota bacterium]